MKVLLLILFAQLTPQQQINYEKMKLIDWDTLLQEFEPVEVPEPIWCETHYCKLA